MKRSVEIELRTHWLRYVGAYVQYANEGGDLPLVERAPEDTERAKFLKLLNCNYTVFGVPLMGNDVAPRKDFIIAGQGLDRSRVDM